MSVRILIGDVREQLKTLPDASVHCCVTSPPYWGLRDYGVSGQIGLESTPAEYVETMVQVFREVRRVLRDDGTCWINLGDSYFGSGKGGNPEDSPFRKQATNEGSLYGRPTNRADKLLCGQHLLPGGIADPDCQTSFLKAKDLVGIPWRAAFALQADGWYLRQDIIWAKPNPMPESVRDRCTKAHEYIFLLSKSERYYFNADAIAENATVGDNGSSFTDERDIITKPGLGMATRKTNYAAANIPGQSAHGYTKRDDGLTAMAPSGKRNKRSVWTVATAPFKEAHFATFPPALIEPCILAGCPINGLVLDPFGGAGTSGLVADRLQRDAVLIELNPEYAAMAQARIKGESPMFADVTS